MNPAENTCALDAQVYGTSQETTSPPPPPPPTHRSLSLLDARRSLSGRQSRIGLHSQPCHHAYGMNVTSSNCSDNYEPKRYSEELITTIIRKRLAEEPVLVYGKEQNVRDSFCFPDHCKTIDLIFKRKAGETCHVGASNEGNNLRIVHEVCQIPDMR